MITDEERREVAANIRNAANRRKDDLNDDPDYSLFAALSVMSCWIQRYPRYKDLLHLADLIDRPTCRIIKSAKVYAAFGELISTMNVYVLSCGHQAVGFEKPDYCPKCGTRVDR